MKPVIYIQGIYQIYDINFLDSAGVPNNPISPNPARDASLAAVLGAILGVSVAIGREQVHRGT